MSQPRRHHYLPRFYLESFSREGTLTIYDRSKNEYRRQIPEKVAVEKDYYAVIDADGKKDMGVERFLEKIEHKASLAIKKLDAREMLTPEENEAIALFVGYMKCRVPDFEKGVNELTEKMLMELSKTLFADEKSAASLMKQMEADAGESSGLTPADMVAFAEGGLYEIKQTNRGYTVDMMITMGHKIANLLMNMDWVILQAPSETAFITTDNPFVLTPPSGHTPGHIYGGYGIATKGALKIMPLSAKSVLMITDMGRRVAFKTLPKHVVRKFNIAIAAGSDQLVMGKDKIVLERMVKEVGLDKWRRTSRVTVD